MLLAGALVGALIAQPARGAPQAAEAAPLILAEKGTARASVLVPARASAVEKYAAQQLATYLSRIIGGVVQVEAEGSRGPKVGKPIISVGRTTLARGLTMQGPEPKRAHPEAFRVVRRADTLLLCGNQAGDACDNGTLWAVYAFLARQGVGRYLPDPLGEVVPARATLAVGALDFTDAPAFAMRGGAGTALNYLEPYRAGEGKGQLAAPNLLAFDRQASAQRCEFFHAYQYVATAQVRKAHPEWFKGTHNSPYPGGDPGPSPHLGHGLADNGIDLSRPEIRALFVEYFRKRFRANPDLKIASIAPDDYTLGYRCDCAECKRLQNLGDPPSFRSADVPRSASDLHIDFVNAVARGLEKEFPDRKLLTYAYNDYLDAPTRTRVHPNVVVMFAPLVSGTNELNPMLDRIVQGWRRMGAKNLYWYGYILTRPPVPHLMGEWFRNYQRAGVDGVYLEFGPVPVTNALNGWLYAKLAWDPHADVGGLIDEFCVGLFGPEVGRVMRRFFLAAWEVNPPLYDEIPALFAAAEKMVGDPRSVAGRRVRFFKLGWELYYSAVQLDEALKAGDIAGAHKVVKAGLEAGKALRREYPWAMRTNVWLQNTAYGEYAVSVLPALETLLKTKVVRPTPEAPVPGPTLCLTNNADVPASGRVDTGVTVSFDPPAAGGADGRKLFDGKVRGPEHNLSHGSAYPAWTITLDLQKTYQVERVELCTGLTKARWEVVPIYIEVQVSQNGKEFRPVERILPRTLKGFVSSGSLYVTARHVRFRLASLNLWHAVSEVRVWGRPIQSQ